MHLPRGRGCLREGEGRARSCRGRSRQGRGGEENAGTHQAHRRRVRHGRPFPAAHLLHLPAHRRQQARSGSRPALRRRLRRHAAAARPSGARPQRPVYRWPAGHRQDPPRRCHRQPPDRARQAGHLHDDDRPAGAHQAHLLHDRRQRERRPEDLQDRPAPRDRRHRQGAADRVGDLHGLQHHQRPL